MKRILPVLMVLALLPALPSVGATHDNNDAFIVDSDVGITAEMFGGTSANMWAVPIDPLNQPTVVYHRTGVATWTPINHNIPIFDALANGGMVISVVSPTSVWVSLSQETMSVEPPYDIAHYDGVIFTPINVPEMDVVRSIWAFSDSDVWVSGHRFTTGESAQAHFNGVAWTYYSMAGFGCGEFITQTLGHWGISPTSLLSSCREDVPGNNKMLLWNGVAWSVLGVNYHVGNTQRSAVRRIWASSLSNIYVTAGDNVYRSTNMGVSWQTVLTVTGMESTIHSSGGVIWVSSTTGLYHSTDGVTFSLADPEGPIGQIRGVWANSATNVYVSGQFSDRIYSYQSNPAVALPNLAGLLLDRDDFNVQASQSQCNGDSVSVRIETDVTIGVGGVDVWVIDSRSNVVVINWNNVEANPAWYNLNNKVIHSRFSFATGEYQLIATIDAMGALAADQFSDWSFGVPLGTCRDTLGQDILPAVLAQFNLTNSYVNTTSETTQSWVTYRSDQTNDYVNTTTQALGVLILHNHDELHNILDNNFTCENCTVASEMTILDLEGYTDGEVGGILLFGGLLVWALWRKWWFVAGTASFGFLAAAAHLDSGWYIASLLFLFLAYWIELIIANRGAVREETI